MDIQRSADCGNSPKNAFAEQVAIRWLSGDPGLADDLADDAVLEWVGAEVIQGSRAITSHAEAEPRPDGIVVEMAVTHGRAGAVAALVRRGEETRGICLALRFASVRADKVQSIKVYAP